MRAILIANPIAGRRRPDHAPELLAERLHDEGVDVTAFATARRGDAERMARTAAAEGVDRVIVAGGDGTISEVVNGLLGASVPIAVIPCGTANVLAAELGLPPDVDQACRVAAHGAPVEIDLGVCNGRVFFLAAGIGLDAALVRGVSPWIKRRLGIVAYWLSAARLLLTIRPAELRLQIDGECRKELLFGAIACNTAYYAGRFRLAPGARADDGRLDVVLIRACGRIALLRAGLALVRGHAETCAVLDHVPVHDLCCETDRPIAVQLDGDDFGDTPVRIHLARGDLRVISGQ